jgi:hypothetical protein
VRVTQNFFDEDDKPISLDEWGQRFERDLVILADPLDGDRTLRTVWLGFADPALPSARMFGTAVMAAGRFVQEVECYDTRQQAWDGHHRHLATLRKERR